MLLALLLALLIAPSIYAAPRPPVASYNEFPPPSQDPFYRVDADIAKYKPGHVLRERAISPAYFGPAAQAAYQLFYRTTGQGQPDGTVTTVVVPKQPTRGVPRLLAIAQPQDSAGLNCNPSYAFTPNSKTNNSQEYALDTMHFAALHQGWFITIPDLGGSKAAFLAGRVEGPAILDGIRATLGFGAYLENAENAKVALYGYSGGAHGSGWASQLASSYAPDLNIVGWTAGGLPANINANFAYLDGTPGAGLDFLGAAGLSNAYPELRKFLQSKMRPNATAYFEAMRNGSICVDQSAVFANKTFSDSFTMPNITQAPVYKDILKDETLGKNQPPLNKFPALLLHSRTDETVPYTQAAQYVKSQCSQGATIKFVSLPTGKHSVTGVEAVPSFVQKLLELFEGVPENGKCTKLGQLPVSPNSHEAMQLMGSFGFMALQKVIKTLNG